MIWWWEVRRFVRGTLCLFGVLHHDPQKHPLGGYKCSFCGAVALSPLEFFDPLEDGHVSSVRRTYAGGRR